MLELIAIVVYYGSEVRCHTMVSKSFKVLLIDGINQSERKFSKFIGVDRYIQVKACQ